MAEVNVWGIVGVAVFYVLILGIGIFAACWRQRKQKRSPTQGSELGASEELMVAGRSIGVVVGIFTMTATWVGGGYINGTAEYVNTSGFGLIWTQAPWGYALSLVLGGLLFARQMRRAGYVTMVDPLTEKYGRVMGGVLFLPALMGELFWSAAILRALGLTIQVIIGEALKEWITILISAAIAVSYTFFGGLFSVAYTDVVQLFCILIGLVLALPFAFTHEAVSDISTTSDFWLGKGNVPNNSIALYIDSALLLMFGGIPWQVYFQRVLSVKTEKAAQVLSFAAAFGCLIMAIPPVLIGAIAASTDWNATDYTGNITADPSKTLPLVLQYLTPNWVSFVGLGAVAAAVMSSSDSSILSASSMFTRNVYMMIFRPRASERELVWILRVAVVIVGGVACIMAIFIQSIYGLWFLCSDLVYVLLFPQLLGAVHLKWVNTYGSVLAFIVGALLRLLGGDATLTIPTIIKYPYFDAENDTQLFPFKTFAMACSLLVLILVSYPLHYVFVSGKLDRKYDFLKCYSHLDESQKEKDVAVANWLSTEHQADPPEKINEGYTQSAQETAF